VAFHTAVERGIIKMKNMCSLKMTGEEAADMLMTGVYVRRVGVTPADPNLYLTIRHLYDRESSVLKNILTGEEQIAPWDNIEFTRHFRFSHRPNGATCSVH
jgi:hypothetical protein